MNAPSSLPRLPARPSPRAGRLRRSKARSLHRVELVLDRSKIPDRGLFRLAEQPGTMILRRDLAEQLVRAGLTGWEAGTLNAPILL